MKHEKVVVAGALALFGAAELQNVCADPRRTFRYPGEGLDEIHYVRSGLLAIYRPDSAGRSAIVALRYPGEAILSGGRLPAFGIRAIVWSEIALSTSAARGTAACLLMTQRNEAIAHEWIVRQHFDADARVAHLLCETAIRSGQGTERMNCPFTQQHIAEITAQTSVNVNRVLADLERHRLIERDKRSITFLNWPELARLGSFKADYLQEGNS
jgi:CRP-like cAMP-binding protein